jgi:hypothetical protein
MLDEVGLNWCGCHLIGGLDHFFIFPYIGNNNPNWLILFRVVETTNQLYYLIFQSRIGEWLSQISLGSISQMSIPSDVHMLSLIWWTSDANCPTSFQGRIPSDGAVEPLNRPRRPCSWCTKPSDKVRILDGEWEWEVASPVLHHNSPFPSIPHNSDRDHNSPYGNGNSP